MNPRRAMAGAASLSRRGSPASSTLPPRHGARQFLSSARSIRTAAALWHGTGRMSARPPQGVRIARWYAHRSLVLPREPHDLQPAARLSGGAAAGYARQCWKRLWWRPRAQGAWRRRRTRCVADAIELPGAMRWVRRRVRLVHNALARVIGLIPDRLAGCVATMGAVRDRLKSKRALMELRGLLAEQLQIGCPRLWASSPMESA